MEIMLNFAWAVFSLGLIWFWIRGCASNPVPRRTQAMALAMVVLLLLPVISLSDDLMAMQGLAETDSTLRRAGHLDEGHSPVAPVSLALLEPAPSSLQAGGDAQLAIQGERVAAPAAILTRSLDRRPPPRV